MNEQQARSRAELARGDHSIPSHWKLAQVERRFIQLGSERVEEPAPARDLLVWVVRFKEAFSWVELALDDRNGTVVRREHSR